LKENAMPEIPFNVSARAAMLIGRENIASSRGAIIELVKNCYDADSPFCIIYIDNDLSCVSERITAEQKKRMVANGIKELYFSKLYTPAGSSFIRNEAARLRYANAFKKRIQKLATLYIIDAGIGMPADIIRSHWMTIGTDNKLLNSMTSANRIKSGAKGIGRFALDKLGRICQMTTIPAHTKKR
jgi:hypothetical protein